ncbi:arylsulfatase B-like isoform X2 [Acanthaster planci]|nr:arylsulfatase B-like isoform X2 [Acanthaster planci]
MPSCLPLDEITVAQKLKELGYSTHLIGKWHLGLYKKACWPTRRGFDTFFGFLLGSEDYYEHQRFDDFDFRDQEELAWSYQGQYATHLFAKRAQDIIARHDKHKPFFMFFSNQAVHAPLQVPSQYLRQYAHIKNRNRKLYAGMTTCMDEAIGNVTETLQEHGLWNNTVLIFSTDNGGDPRLGASNWPLRGGKRTLWEGGVRGIGFVHSPLLHPRVRGTQNRELIHVSDWFPTIVTGLAGGKLNGPKPLDGYNMWDTIRFGSPSPRNEILHNIDPFEGHDHPFTDSLYNNFTFTLKMRSAIRVGDWKLLTGPVGEPRNWIPPVESRLKPEQPHDPPDQTVWLFNIRDDPYERYDKSAERPDIVEVLITRLQEHYTSSVPIIYPPDDPKAEPKLHNNTWTNWE